MVAKIPTADEQKIIDAALEARYPDMAALYRRYDFTDTQQIGGVATFLNGTRPVPVVFEYVLNRSGGNDLRIVNGPGD
ncbi:hypothetical protein [Pseudomonas farris]